MTHGSLFSGIGGFDLASEWMGWENVFHCEWNEFGQRVLNHYWPNAISYHDITKTDFTIHRGRIDVLTGGFPCQPYSTAGKRLGKEDDRHLWPEMLRAIREIAPRWVVGENVLGLVNWNGGLVFDEVQADLEAEGYEVQPFVLPACAVNAPHRRDRVWFVAKNTNNNGWDGEQREGEPSKWEQRNFSSRNNERIQTNDGKVKITSDTNLFGNDRAKGEKSCFWTQSSNEQSRDGGSSEVDGLSNERIAPDPNGSRWEKQYTSKISSKQEQHSRNAMHTNSPSKQREHIGQKGQGELDRPNSGDGINNFSNFPTQSPICFGDDGLPTELDGITFPKWRNESIKAAGNAVVPQVVYQIFKSIDLYIKTESITH